MKKCRCSCLLCKNEMTASGLSCHYGSKLCLSGKTFEQTRSSIQVNSDLICQFCLNEFSNANSFRNHVRCCPKNPDRDYHNGMTGKPGWAKGLTKDNDSRVEKISDTLKFRYKHDLEPKGCCSKEYLESDKAQVARIKGGGYRERAGRSKKFKVEDSFGKLVCLQSSFEFRCSIILNSMGIRWNRPKALYYGDRRYFADFYLVDFDIYLDPKNDYKARLDEEKIRLVREENNISLFVLLEHQINEDYITHLLAAAERHQTQRRKATALIKRQFGFESQQPGCRLKPGLNPASLSYK